MKALTRHTAVALAALVLLSMTFLQACSRVEDKIIALQEKAWQSGVACINNENLHACSDFVNEFGQMTQLMEPRLPEFVRKAREGDEKSEKIMHNADRLINMAEVISR